MSTLDWVVFLLFIAYVVWDGMRRAATAKDLEGYYAGGRKIPWWAAGLSIMATQASAITVIGTTGQGHEGGLPVDRRAQLDGLAQGCVTGVQKRHALGLGELVGGAVPAARFHEA